VSLPDDEDYLMRPVLAGMMRLESLLDGTLDLAHIAWANEALNVKEENERRHREAQENRR
jgi:hypothetical protein